MAQVTVRWLDDEGALNSCALDQLDSSRGAKWRWVDVLAPDEPTMTLLAKEFGLHPLSVEDAIHPQQRPKIDLYPDGLFVVWLTPERPEGDGIVAREMDFSIGTDHLITMHAAPDPVIEDVLHDATQILSRGPDWLLHALIDRLVDATLPIVDALGDELDDIEDAMLGNPRQTELAILYATRRQLVQMHRIAAPERDILRSLARERDVVSEEAYRYFEDVGDHLARVTDAIDTYRDVGAGVMDIYLSAQSNRMNEIMKQLTVVATIFMPLTLLSGIYGMNVLKGMWPPVEATWSFFVVIGTMLMVAAWMALYFRRKNWW